MGKPQQQTLIAPPAGMLPQDRAMLDAIVRDTYQRYQAGKAAGMADFVVRRGPDVRIRKWDPIARKPTRDRFGGQTWREVGLAMYGEDFAERLAVRLDSVHAGRVR